MKKGYLKQFQIGYLPEKENKGDRKQNGKKA
jgi:hypothetical protein